MEHLPDSLARKHSEGSERGLKGAFAQELSWLPTFFLSEAPDDRRQVMRLRSRRIGVFL